jgi:hypothetical protein
MAHHDDYKATEKKEILGTNNSIKSITETDTNKSKETSSMKPNSGKQSKEGLGGKKESKTVLKKGMQKMNRVNTVANTAKASA